jgi:transmembrane protein 216
MNTSLTFEVLLYLNSYYFGLFAVCETGMNVVKYMNFPDLKHFSTDFGILMAVCVIELFRVILARKGNLTERSKSRCCLSFSCELIVLF